MIKLLSSLYICESLYSFIWYVLRFASGNDLDLEFSAEEQAKIGTLEKEVEKRRKSEEVRPRPTSFSRRPDRSTGSCFGCKEVGHWQYDSVCKLNQAKKPKTEK